VTNLPEDFPNHQQVRRGLARILDPAALVLYDQSVQSTAGAFIKLARAHLRDAKRLPPSRSPWRSVVSRAYYAVYSASRAVRYLVYGHIDRDVEDHKKVGELPNDFPDRASWSTKLVSMRKDRNLADYESGPESYGRLTSSPTTSLQDAEQFLRIVLSYLNAKGLIA
jgi:uncharacterized protein (UPF0332 family)